MARSRLASLGTAAGAQRGVFSSIAGSGLRARGLTGEHRVAAAGGQEGFWSQLAAATLSAVTQK